MESEIFKFICANQGAVDTEYLMFNLGIGDSSNVSEIIRNREKFATCCPFGQPKVVARTKLRLCRGKDCQGSCRGLHLCKNFLFSGSCQFSQRRRGCTFSHELDSDYNKSVLREHELEYLSMTELRTLLLQSDDRILPPICYDYNNGVGEFGRCQDGFDCKRLHVCEKFVNHDCSCSRTHDFNAPHPMKRLHDRGVPHDLIGSLKSVYANIQALKYFDRCGDKGNKDESQQRGGYPGNRGNRSNRGNQDNRQQLQHACSTSDISAVGPYSYGQLQQLKSFTNYISAATNDTDASSDNGQNRKLTQNLNKTSTAFRGRHGNRGNRGNRGNSQQLQQARSTNDIFAAVNDDTKSDDGASRREDKTEICMYFIKGHCKHKERCFKAHDKMPYRWEVRKDDRWTPMHDNETIEKDYCDPKNTYSVSSPPVHFDTMTCGPNQVRRLSTINSLRQPTFILTTEWLWYWEDEFGKWNMYASTDGGHRPADMDSSKLEQKFLDNDKDVVEFIAGSQSYSLSFQDMIQTNKKFGTKRLVKRRPRFVSAADVQTAKVRKPLGQQTLAAVPDHWDKTQIPPTGYRRVSLQSSSKEFKEIEALFCKTMKGFDIVKIERIQNKALWEVFQWQKTQMMNNNNGLSVKEEQLFHGTDKRYVDVICHTNFDWRICGTHGTAFGKGSYFARKAKYSHAYTGESDVKSMFISRLLVGDYTKGSPDYRRPPSKDGGDINFFDSCVDDIVNPSIYVVFEKHQIYPEYLLQYKAMHPLAALYGDASVPAPKPAQTLKPVPAPRPTPQPTVSVFQPSTSSYQRSTSSYQPSTSSYQPSTSSYQPSTSSYQPSTSSYQPSTSSYQPSTSSYQTRTLPYRSSIASYSHQSTQSSISSPTIPPAKKASDSCVIA